MAFATRFERGQAMMKKVYGDVVEPPAQGALPLTDLMIEQLFAEVWSREQVMSVRDRRLLLLGAISALGEAAPFGVQARAALAKRELSPEQLREVLLHLAQYIGYPRVVGLLGVVEEAIADFSKAPAADADTR